MRGAEPSSAPGGSEYIEPFLTADRCGQLLASQARREGPHVLRKLPMHAAPLLTIDQIQAPRPDVAALKPRYEEWERSLAQAEAPQAAIATIQQWDAQRRELETWSSLVHLRFNQDTTDAAHKAQRAYCDEITPQLTDLDVRIKRRLLGGPHRDAIAAQFGPQALALWEADVLAFDPRIEPALVEEAQLQAEYSERTAQAAIPFDGAIHNLSSIVKFREVPDRATRHAAELARWQWFADHRPELDRIFQRLVALRHQMAKQLGYPTFIELGYRRMKRIDYGQPEVERFREEVRRHVVPLAQELRRQQAATLGLAHLKFWDEALFDPAGNPAPHGGHDWLIQRAQGMFDALHPALGAFFRLMQQERLMDLDTRPGKSPGGFCTAFPTVGLPFIFANFNGSKGDVEVFTHEMGHAFQAYASRHLPLVDYLWPTSESCEIHSMGLEFLTWPQMEQFFEHQAQAFRRLHLVQSLLFLPYGVAVDHFQHLVYTQPDAGSEAWHACWQEMERRYLPWRDYGDLPHLPSGGFWQFQRHIYLSPFYYIDYTLALACALQLWLRAQRDPAGTLRTYLDLCACGGQWPFQQLVRRAGLTSPFTPGCLADVVQQAREYLADGPPLGASAAHRD